MLSVAPPALAGDAKQTRTAELLLMGRSAPPGSTQPPDNQQVSDLVTGFRLLDVSCVGDTMRESFEVMGSDTHPNVTNAALAALAPYSSIAVPGWMRTPVLSALPVSSPFVPGCMMVSYKPSEFLPPHVEERRRATYGAMSMAACEAGIPVGLFDALILAESAYSMTAVSPKRAYGLAQLMPGTAAGLGVDRFDPIQNLKGGARYLRAQLDSFGQVPLALAAYNAGPGRVKGGRVPNIAETRNYVREVLEKWSRLASGQRTATVFDAGRTPVAPSPDQTVSTATIQLF